MKKRAPLTLLFPCVCNILLISALFYIFNSKVLFLGPDYRLELPRLFEGLLSIQAQGFAPPYYSSFLCGGFPLYADPQSLFYSIPQLLLLGLNPWEMIIFSTILFSSFGFWGVSVLLKDQGVASINAALCGALFGLNGFFISRILIGHLGFHSFMIAPFLVWAIINRSVSPLRSSLIGGMLIAYSIYSGGHYAIFIILTTTMLSILILSAFNTAIPLRSIPSRFIFTLCIAFCISASKITASLFLMTQHPRKAFFDRVPSFTDGVLLIWSQLTQTIDFKPFDYGVWEYNASVPFIVCIAFGMLIPFAFQNYKKKLLACIIVTLLIADIATGYSLVSEQLQKLPILNQLRANIRLTAAFILPLTLLAGFSFEKITKNNTLKTLLCCVVLYSCWSQVSFLAHQSKDYRSYSFTLAQSLYQNIRTGIPPKVERIGSPREDDLVSMSLHESNPTCYVTMFARPPNKRLQESESVYTTDGRVLNMMHPACYWFPKENECRRGARISIADKSNLDLLIAHQNPNWQVHWIQKLANWISFLSIISALFFLIVSTASSRKNWQCQML